MDAIKVVGSRFLEIEAKRDPNFSGKLELKTNIGVESLEKEKEIINVKYFFEVNYGKLGKIKIKGILFVTGDKKTIKTIMDNNKKKQYNGPEYLALTNFIIKKASIKAFELEEELNLPIHIKLPSLSLKKE